MIERSKWSSRSRVRTFFMYVSVFALVLTVSACNATSVKENRSAAGTISITPDSLDRVVEIVIDVSARDFAKNQVPPPSEFRSVSIRYLVKPSQEVLYILCGEFRTGEKEPWVPFTTIKNSDYEQWIGPNGATYCEQSTVMPYPAADLSSLLIKRFRAVQ